jgi:spore germination cell wall hydrolase CwlJ-like protein
VPKALRRLRNRIVFHWLARDGGGAAFIAMLAVPIVALTSIVAFAYSGRARDEPRRLVVAQQRADDIRCLAENVYFEARGEPLNGQYAVAEVTINRLRSPYFPKTICGVVHDTRWDPLRRRFTAHFSWTQMQDRGEPWGPLWQQSMAVATAVINDTYMPIVPDALYYHADSVQPYWANAKRSVAKIGSHVFYR